MTEDELVNFIRLARTEQIGPITFQRLMQLYPDAAMRLRHYPIYHGAADAKSHSNRYRSKPP